MSGLAICGIAADRRFYLFGCDHNWNTITDTWYTTIGEAIEQAEDEYKEPVPLGPRNTMPKAL